MIEKQDILLGLEEGRKENQEIREAIAEFFGKSALKFPFRQVLEEWKTAFEFELKQERKEGRKECSECGFPEEWEREPIFINTNIFSLLDMLRETDKCKKCKHQKDGSTITKIQPLLRRFFGAGENVGKEETSIILFDKFEKLVKECCEKGLATEMILIEGLPKLKKEMEEK